MYNLMFGSPGVRALVSTNPREILWGGDASRQKLLRGQGRISSTTVDAGSTPTSQIRPGLLLGRLTADNELVHWDPTATNGSQFLHAVLDNGAELAMQEGIGQVAADKDAPVLFQAPLKAKQLLVLGVALLSSPHQYLARRLLHQMGCVLDDDPQGYLAGVTRRTIGKTATGSITAAENGAIFNVVGGAAVTLTLPTLATGLSYKFVNLAGQNLVIASAGSSDDIVALNDLSADSITFSTANQLIGAQCDIYSDYVNGTLKWISTVQVGTGTIA